MSLSAADLVKELSTIVDPLLAEATIKSYIEMQQRFLAGDWKPAELDGGRLCEAVSRCLLQLDQGHITHSELPGSVRGKLLDPNLPRKLNQKDREHIVKVVDLAYKFRSDRGAVHISVVDDANQMD